MKNPLVINPIPLTCSIKKLIFVFIFLLVLPFSGCKSVVKETDVEKPVRIVSPKIQVFVVKNPSKFSVPSAHKQLIKVGYNDPNQGHRQELVVAENVPLSITEHYLQVQKNLNDVIGGYPNYIQFIYDEDGTAATNAKVLKRLSEIQYKGKKRLSLKDFNPSCLAASDPGGSRTSKTTPYSVCLQTLSHSQNPFDGGGATWQRQTRISRNYAHEYFHHYQRVKAMERGLDYQSGMCSVDAPRWWIEGAAVTFQNAWFRENWKNIPALKNKGWEKLKGEIIGNYTRGDLYEEVRRALMGTAGNKAKDCQKSWNLSSRHQRYDSGDNCVAQYLAVPFMAYKSSYKTVWIDIPNDYYEIGFWGALEKHLGLSEQEFYDEFNAFMRSGNVGSNPPKGWKPRDQEISKYANFTKVAPPVEPPSEPPPKSDTSSPVVKVSGYTSSNASATSNVFVLKEVTSEFSVGDIVTFGDSKKEHEIVKVKALNKSESGNSQSIILMDGVGFVVKKGWKVSVVKETDVEEPVRLVSPNGDVYVGEVMSGEPHGQGTLTFTDGRMYVGQYKDGKMDGNGTFTYSNGSKYEGEWKEGKQDGQGTLTLSSGNKYEGEFKDGKPWNGTLFVKNGNIFGKFVNGEWIKN